MHMYLHIMYCIVILKKKKCERGLRVVFCFSMLVCGCGLELCIYYLCVKFACNFYRLKNILPGKYGLDDDEKVYCDALQCRSTFCSLWQRS